jgi:hypothetical protein
MKFQYHYQGENFFKLGNDKENRKIAKGTPKKDFCKLYKLPKGRI